ncbi:MICOS complex subunit MIC26-like [Myripristis murdjan]|uniref:MICOS complex subunit MIC26-like n=1 Tax=Myripristis murdjan TaxID=586833 RepID=UPI001175E75D|nr:MICOS complex subunit MIC26-like [Myripristis murdjan]
MLKVTGSAMPGALNLMSFTVFAAGEDEPNVPLNREDLSLYTSPQQKFRYVEPEAGQLEQSVATLRKAAEPYAQWCQGAFGKIKPKVQRVIQFGNDTYAYLKDPPKDFYPRAGVIGAAGVLGLFLGRGSRIKKLIYPAGLVTVSASMYYPERAAAIAKSTGESVYDWALQSYVNIDKILKPEKKAEEKAERKAEESSGAPGQAKP